MQSSMLVTSSPTVDAKQSGLRLPQPQPPMGLNEASVVLKKKKPSSTSAFNKKHQYVDPEASLELALQSTALPKNLVERLRKDAQDCAEYHRLVGVEHLYADEALFTNGDFIQVESLLKLQAPIVDGFNVSRCASVKDLRLNLPQALAPYMKSIPTMSMLEADDANSSSTGNCIAGCFMPCCRGTRQIGNGEVGGVHNTDNDTYSIQRAGYHTYDSCNLKEMNTASTTKYNEAIVFGRLGFVNITEGFVGKVCVSGVYSFVPQGVWQWNSPEVQFLGCHEAKADGKPVVCGTAGFVIIPEGYIAVLKVDTTYRFYNHGMYCWNNSHVKFTALQQIDFDTCHSWGATGYVSISEGNMGIVRVGSQAHFLQQGTFQWSSPNVQFLGVMRFEVDKVVKQAASGFVTISEGKIGVMQVGSDYRLLVQGTYVWNSPSVNFLKVVDVSNNDRCVALGPYTLTVVPDGYAALTYNNGVLNVLTANVDTGCSTYFLSHPKWRFEEMLCLQMQTDKLEGNNLLSKDNVELIMVAMSQWRIADPALAATNCASTMEEIRGTVNDLIRATISRIVAGTAIGAGPVGGAVQKASGAVTGTVVGGGEDEMGLAQLMQSEGATKHMADLSANLNAMGVEVAGVFVPEKRMKNDDIRREVAKQAVIGIQAEAERAAADAKAYATVKSAHAEAEAKRATADATAYSIVQASKAQAEAIENVARARGEAGKSLGDCTTTASRLALTEATTNAYKDAKITIFSGAPKDMAYMMTPAPFQQ